MPSDQELGFRALAHRHRRLVSSSERIEQREWSGREWGWTMNAREVIMHRDGIFMEHYHSQMMKKQKKKEKKRSFTWAPPLRITTSVSFHCTMVPFWGEVKGGPTWFGSAGNTPHTDSVGTPCWNRSCAWFLFIAEMVTISIITHRFMISLQTPILTQQFDVRKCRVLMPKHKMLQAPIHCLNLHYGDCLHIYSHTVRTFLSPEMGRCLHQVSYLVI